MLKNDYFRQIFIISINNRKANNLFFCFQTFLHFRITKFRFQRIFQFWELPNKQNWLGNIRNRLWCFRLNCQFHFWESQLWEYSQVMIKLIEKVLLLLWELKNKLSSTKHRCRYVILWLELYFHFTTKQVVQPTYSLKFSENWKNCWIGSTLYKYYF